MTSVYSRSPLQSLGMNHAPDGNGQRRNLRRTLDDGHEGPPSKRPRKSAAISGATPQTSSSHKPGPSMTAKPNGPTRLTRAKAKVQDDFTFSKRRPARKDACESQAPGVSVSTTNTSSPQEQRRVETQLATPRKSQTPPKRKARRTLPATPELDQPLKVSKPRRSKRLSKEDGAPFEPTSHASQQSPKASLDTANVHTPQQTAPCDQSTIQTPALTLQDTERDNDSPVLSAAVLSQSLYVEKKRKTVKINLLLAETPVIRRNKQLRKVAAEGTHRRSSSGMRGSRVSSLMGSGSSSALPHPNVPGDDYYKHICQDLQEQERMRTLLFWSGHRALPKRDEPSSNPDQSRVSGIARKIFQQLVADFANRGDLSSWFDRPETPADTAIKQSNPRNVQNAARLDELEAELARLREEERNWDELEARTARNFSAQASHARRYGLVRPESIDQSLLDTSQAELLQSICPSAQSSAAERSANDTDDQITTAPETSSDILQSTRETLHAVFAGLEFKIDLLADNAHRIEQYRVSAERVADKILALGAERLEERNRKLVGQGATTTDMSSEGNGSGDGSLDAMDLLRALSRTAKIGGEHDASSQHHRR